MKPKKSFNHKKPIKEGSMSNFESVTQFKEQVERYILKHKDNPNAVINDLASGLFFAFSEAFSKDGRPETNGLNMLEKMINKLRVLMKTHENLIPKEEEDFEDFETSDSESEMEEDENEVQNMVDDLDNNTSMDEEEEEEINGIYESKECSGMKRYSGLKERLFKEEKQVGVLYHFTNSVFNVSDILEYGLMGSEFHASRMGDLKTFKSQRGKYSFSFSRLKKVEGFNKPCYIKIDGNKISQKYQVFPIAEIGYNKSDKSQSQYEERLLANKRMLSIKPYLLEIGVRKDYYNDFTKNQELLDHSNIYFKLEKFCKENNIKLELF